MTARAQPTPNPKPIKNPMMLTAKKFISSLNAYGANGLQNAVQDRRRAWRTPCNRVVYRNDVGNAAPTGIALAKHSAASRTVPNRDNQFRVRDGVIRAFQGFFHIHRYRAGHQ